MGRRPRPLASPPPRAAAPRGTQARGRRTLVAYVLRFALGAVALFGIYHVAEVTGRFQRVNAWNAAASGALLRLGGQPVVRRDTTVTMSSGGMEIISECSAIYVAILYTAAVLAFPTRWRARLLGLALGLPCIFAINILRLVTLGLVIEHRAELLPLVHEYLWQVFFVLVVATLYLLWIERIVPRESSPAALGS